MLQSLCKNVSSIQEVHPSACSCCGLTWSSVRCIKIVTNMRGEGGWVMVRGEGLRNVEMCKCRVGMLCQCPNILVMVLSIVRTDSMFTIKLIVNCCISINIKSFCCIQMDTFSVKR